MDYLRGESNFLIFLVNAPMTCKEGGRKVQAKAFNFFGSSQATIIGVGIAVSSLVCPQDTSLSEWTHVLPVSTSTWVQVLPDASHWGGGSLVHSQRYPIIHRWMLEQVVLATQLRILWKIEKWKFTKKMKFWDAPGSRRYLYPSDFFRIAPSYIYKILTAQTNYANTSVPANFNHCWEKRS